MNANASTPSSYIYEKGRILIFTEWVSLRLFATHYLSAKMEHAGHESRFYYTFTKVGFIDAHTPASECTVQHISTQNAFRIGDRVVIIEQDDWYEYLGKEVHSLKVKT